MTKINRKSLYLSGYLCLGTLLVALLFILAGTAFASPSDTSMGDVFCTVGSWFNGNLGKGIAVTAVSIVGIGTLLNRVSWSMAITVMCNIAVIFGAVTIVDALGASPNVVCAMDVSGTPNGLPPGVFGGSGAPMPPGR